MFIHFFVLFLVLFFWLFHEVGSLYLKNFNKSLQLVYFRSNILQTFVDCKGIMLNGLWCKFDTALFGVHLVEAGGTIWAYFVVFASIFPVVQCLSEEF